MAVSLETSQWALITVFIHSFAYDPPTERGGKGRLPNPETAAVAFIIALIYIEKDLSISIDSICALFFKDLNLIEGPVCLYNSDGHCLLFAPKWPDD